MQGELEQLKSEILSTIAEVESCEREERMARVRLMEVSRDFQAYSEEDIKQAYEEAHRLQVQLSALREKKSSCAIAGTSWRGT